MAAQNTNRQTIAERLRFARDTAGLTQAQAAKLLYLHRPSISEIEAGRRKVSADELAKFAEIYGVSVAWLAGNIEEGRTPAVERMRLAARELSRLSADDLDMLLKVIGSLRAAQDRQI